MGGRDMNVLKYAFEEGRDTKISWEKSQSLKHAHLLEIQLNNIKNIRLRKGRALKLAQLHPTSGKVINVFPSGFAAARWVWANNKKYTSEVQKYQIFGNMQSQLVKGAIAYGYYWILLDPDSDAEVTWDKNKKRKPKKKFVVVKDGIAVKVLGYPKLQDMLKIKKQYIVRKLKKHNNVFEINGMMIYTQKAYDNLPIRRKIVIRNTKGHFKGNFTNYSSAAKYLNVHVLNVVNAVRSNKPIGQYKVFEY
jgi:hypothetical protein